MNDLLIFFFLIFFPFSQTEHTLWKWCVPFLYPSLPGVIAFPPALESHLGCFLLSIWQRYSVTECAQTAMLSICHSSSVSSSDCSGSAQGLQDKATGTVCGQCRSSRNTQAAVDRCPFLGCVVYSCGRNCPSPNSHTQVIVTVIFTRMNYNECLV